MVGTTALTTVALAVINPFLPLVMLYDYYLLLGFTKVLNQTTFMIVLEDNKRDVFLNKLNFLGYRTEMTRKRTSLKKFTFMGEYINKYITLDNRGLLPSLSRMMNFGRIGGSKKPIKTSGMASNETQIQTSNGGIDLSQDKNNFKRFWKFMADNETYLIPIDHEDFAQCCMNVDLLNDIVNGRQNKVLSFDFS